METYTIVSDQDELESFIEWLPDLEPNEKFYYCLFARKKYDPELVKSNDKTQLYRGVTTKERMIEDFKALERPLGKWIIKGNVASQKSLALYIMPNPRDLKAASFMLSQKLANMVYEGAIGYNPIQEAKSAIQKSKSYNYVVDFDIDDIDVDFSDLWKILPKDTYTLVETRGGYHLMVFPQKATIRIQHINKAVDLGHTSKIFKRDTNWFMKLKEKYAVDQSSFSDQLLPVPGCIQGEFTPRIITL